MLGCSSRAPQNGGAHETVSSVSSEIIVNGQTTGDRPVGTFFSATGKKYLSWAGTDDHRRINLLTSDSDDVWGSEQTLGESVLDGAGIALAEFNGRLYLAWTGTDTHINLLSSDDGVSWGQKITFGTRSDHGPALASLGGQLYIAHTGEDNHLFIQSSPDGSSFTGTSNLGELSDYGPSLTGFSGHLLIGWTGLDDELNVMEVNPSGLNTLDKLTLPETSDEGTWIQELGDELLIAWRGSDNEHLNFAPITECDLLEMLVQHGGSVAPRKTILGDTSEVGPSLADFNGSAAIIWRGTDDHVNVHEHIREAVPDPDPNNSDLCFGSGHEHPVPATLAAATAEANDRLYRLLTAWLLRFDAQSGDFGNWDGAGNTGLRRVSAGLATQKALEDSDSVTNPSVDLQALRALRPPSNFSALVENWLVANAQQGKAVVGTDGDFDFVLTAAMTVLNGFGNLKHPDGTQYLTDLSVRHLLVYGSGPGDCGGSADIRACGRTVPLTGPNVNNLSHHDWITIPETENHVLMINTWAYLANQWVRDNPRNDSYLTNFNASNPAAFINTGTNLEQALLSIVSRFLKNGAFEENAHPYQGYTLRALMQLAGFAESPALKTGAQNALDYLSALVALQSFQGKRYVPMRRIWDNRSDFDVLRDDYGTIMFDFLSGAYSFDDDPTLKCTAPNCLWGNPILGDQYRGFTLDSYVSGYKLPILVKHLMLRPDDEQPGFGVYTQGMTRYSRSMYGGHLSAQYPAPNVMGDNDWDALARAQTTAKSDDAYVPTTEQYFATRDFFNASGGRYNEFGVAGITDLELSVTPEHALHSYDFLAKPSSVLLPGGKVAWRTAAEAERTTAMMRGEQDCPDGTGYCSLNGPVYKNVALGYDIRDNFPVKTPVGWDQSTTVTFDSQLKARVITPPDGSVHVLVAGVNGHGAGLMEVIPNRFSVDDILSISLQRNAGLRLDVSTNYGPTVARYHTVVSDELLQFDTSFGAVTGIFLDQINGIPAKDIDPATYGDVVSYPLLLARQVDQNYQFTGVEYVRAMGDGFVQMTDPFLGDTLTLDSRDSQNPSRSSEGRVYHRYDFDSSWLPPVFGFAIPGAKQHSLRLTPNSSGRAAIQSIIDRSATNDAPGALSFLVSVSGNPAAQAQLKVTLSNGATGSVQLGATARLTDLLAAGATKLVFNVPAATLATLGTNSAAVTLAISLDQANGAIVDVSDLRSTAYRTGPDGQGAFGRWDNLWTTSAATQSSANATAGTSSQRVCGAGYRTLESSSFNPRDISWISHRVAVDVRIPTGLPNPSWHGALQLYYFNRPANIQAQYAGQVDLTGLPTGEWTTVSFLLPEPVYQQLKLDRSGSSLQLALNADAASGDCFQFDNVRFLGSLDLNARPVQDPPIVPVLSSAQRVFDCERDEAWHTVDGPNPTLVETPRTGGSFGLSVDVSNYTVVESDLFFTEDLTTSGSTLALDIFPPPPANPAWSGDLSLFVECPAANLWNQWAGVIPMPSVSGFTTMQFALPTPLQQALAASNECRLRLAFNGPPNAGTFVIDSLRLVP